MYARAQAAGLHNGLPVLDTVPVPVAVIDRSGLIRAANKAWVRNMPGFNPGALYPRQCEAALRVAADRIEAGMRAVLNEEEECVTLDCSAWPAEQERIVRISMTPFRDEEFSGVLVTHLEMSRMKPDADRRQSEKMMAVGRLVGGIAHDFANLLTLISGYSEMMLGRMPEADPLRPELEEIRSAANRGSRLTAQLLGFTRAQTTETKIQDLNGLVIDMERMLRPIIGENVELVRAPDPTLGKVLADSGQLEQVIMNLVLNARDAMPRGGRITIATTNAELDEREARAHGVRPGQYVVIAFGDTGEGMDADTMTRLFQPFFTTKPKGRGTGLGLSTAYSIVRQNGGDIWASSEPGVGSTFTFCLPRVETPAAEGASETPQRRSAVSGHETILLVEDEDGVRRLLKHVLSRQGYTVLDARDGPVALDTLKAHPGRVHLLLTDMVMPGMTGPEVATEVLKFSPDTHVIYMSGYTDDVLMRSGALGPGMSFLQKPLRPETLGAKVREVLDAAAAKASGR